MWGNARPIVQPSIEELRKKSRILVIDDQDFPFLGLFQRDNYHIERWAEIENLTKLTDGYFDVVLLDINGVGLRESPTRQGLGILEHVKHQNPAQHVILYSSKPQSITQREVLILADVVLDKKSEYVDYKRSVDDLLISRYNPGYFISVMNRELGPNAANSPRAVSKALRALRNGRTDGLRNYLAGTLQDQAKADVIVTVISIGAKVLEAVL